MSSRARRKYSVALICYSYPPVLGGSEIEAQRVSAALRARGHDIEVFCGGGPPMPAQARWVDPAGVPVRLFGGGSVPPRLRGYVYALRVAWTLLRDRGRFDIVYFLMSGFHLATGLPAARWAGKSVLMKFSGSDTIRMLSTSGLGRLEIGMLRRWAGKVLILNEGMIGEARDAGLDPGGLAWMPNPVDTGEFAPLPASERMKLRAQLGLPPDAHVVTYVGRLAPEKELASLLGAFARVLARHPGARLVLVGDGPERTALERRARELSIDGSVRFTGAVQPAAVLPWLQAGDSFALVSRLEGFPCSLSEAMSVGLPSVVTDIPGNTQLIDDGVHGLLAPLRDEAALAAGLMRLAEDAPLAARMGEAARARIVANYSTGAIADRYEEIFDEIRAADQEPRFA